MDLSGRINLNKYQIKKLFIFIFFIIYTIVGFFGNRYALNGEYFPVFSWSLFSEVKNPWESVEIEIISIGEKEFSEPVNYFDLDGYFESSDARSTAITKASRRLLTLYSRDPTEAERMRIGFEQSFLSGRGAVTYQLVYLRYDPLVRIRSGEVIERKVLWQFSTEQAR